MSFDGWYNGWRISIHSLRGEGDKDYKFGAQARSISIHSLRGEGDFMASPIDIDDEIDFNPLPPWGGRHNNGSDAIEFVNISIHSLRGEGDVVIIFHTA